MCKKKKIITTILVVIILFLTSFNLCAASSISKKINDKLVSEVVSSEDNNLNDNKIKKHLFDNDAEWKWNINGYWKTDVPGDWDIVVPCDYPTIQEAVREANIGDRIFVREGIYNENVEINKDGIILQGEGRDTTIVDGNKISNTLRINASYAKVSGFTFTNSGFFGSSILLQTASSNILQDNKIVNNKGNGIELRHSHGNIIINNIIGNNKKGILIKSSSLGNAIAYNFISSNRKNGIECVDGSNYNIIHHNNFIDNTVNTYDICRNYWDKSEKGNYWDDYVGFDLNDDKIGDLPYEITCGSNVDRYPLMNPVNISIYQIETNDFPEPEKLHYKPIFLEGKTITVDDDGDGDYIKIQYALDNADPGDTVEVYSGKYKENIEILSGIILKGVSTELGDGDDTGKPILAGDGDEDIVTITGDSVRISGFEIKNTNLGQAGIKIKGNFNYVNDTFIYDCGNGISVIGSDNIVQNNLIKNNNFGIYSNSSNNFIFKENSIESNVDGIVLVESNGLMNDNNLKNNINNGVLQHYCYNVNIRNNTFVNHVKYAIQLFNSENCVIEENTMVDNFRGGITLFKTSKSVISRNDISKNIEGISLWYSHNNQVLNNKCEENHYGLDLSYSDKNIISDNDLINSTKAGIYLGMSKNNVLRLNNMVYCSILVDSYQLSCWWNDVDQTNTANGKIIYYVINETGLTSFPDAGQIILVNCSTCIIDNLNLHNVSAAIELSYSDYNSITDNIIHHVRKGLVMVHSSHNIIDNNTIYNSSKKSIFISWDSNFNEITKNVLDTIGEVGLALEACDDNLISDNIIVNIEEQENANQKYKSSISVNDDPADSRRYIVEKFFFKIGAALGFGSNNNLITNNSISGLNIGIAIGHIIPTNKGNKIINNTITDNDEGIVMGYSTNNYVIGNTIINSYFAGIAMDWLSDCNYIINNHIEKGYGGIGLRTCNNNIIYGNTICEFDYKGLFLWYSANNIIQKNNFINNSRHASFNNGYDNVWESNYWDNYVKVIRNHPKIILGGINLINNKTPYVGFRLPLPWFNFDKNPALEPNEINLN